VVFVPHGFTSLGLHDVKSAETKEAGKKTLNAIKNKIAFFIFIFC